MKSFERKIELGGRKGFESPCRLVIYLNRKMILAVRFHCNEIAKQES